MFDIFEILVGIMLAVDKFAILTLFIFPPGFINCWSKFIEEFKLLFNELLFIGIRGLEGISLPELFRDGDFGFMSGFVRSTVVCLSVI